MSEELPVSPLDCEDDTDCSPGEGQSGLAIRRNISGKSWTVSFDKNIEGGTGQLSFYGAGQDSVVQLFLFPSLVWSEKGGSDH